MACVAQGLIGFPNGLLDTGLSTMFYGMEVCFQEPEGPKHAPFLSVIFEGESFSSPKASNPFSDQPICFDRTGTVVFSLGEEFSWISFVTCYARGGITEEEMDLCECGSLSAMD